MEKERYPMIRPEHSGTVYSGERRAELDLHNEALLYHQVPVDFVFIGDSITHFWDVHTHFNQSGMKIVNRGIGGDTSSAVLKRFDADVIQLKPQYAVIKIGINDTWTLDAQNPLDRLNAEQIEPTIVTNIVEMVRIAREHRIIPILCSILPNGMTNHDSMEIRNRLIRRINEQLNAYCSRNNLIYVDYHKRMCEPDGLTLRSELTYDGLHLDIFGYNVLAKVLQGELSRHGIAL
ncbi:GDSL-type esterase/lipase family protein [Paenibacillus prosopidis]|uniref:Lysophospholipase L1-like esterase n=1 Tax=Paenibacillus prosopidis TaxID=630520 RepID=A0A368W5H6_9BACL|nr:GDSL-type esterase/lipase family protein [Paenibacillus prosopidis]RCW49003.1 lysophospholipase L1-like esterase [Paenibacillus prosopidis]